MNAPKTNAPSLEQARLTPLSAYQKRLFVFLSVATFFEGYDFFAITQVLPHLRVAWSLNHLETSYLLAFINFGTVLAYFVIGRADRWGRKRVLTFTILGYTLLTALSGLAPNVQAFAVCQMIARIFLIGEWATSMVIAAEEFPASRRGMVMGVVGATAALGSVLCVIVVPPLTKAFGWRSVYFAAIIPLLLVAYARRGLRETGRFVEAEAARAKANTPPTAGGILAILRGPERGRVLQLGAIWFLTYVATQNAVSVWKDYAMTELAMAEKRAGLIMTIAALLAMPLSFASGKLIDVVGRKKGATLIMTGLSAGVLGSYTLRNPAFLTVCVTLCVVGASAVLTVLNAFSTELFPTEKRAAAFGASNNLIGRTGYWLPPILIGQLAMSTGWGLPLRLTAAFPMVALILIWLFLPETSGRELEEIAKDS